MQTNKKKASRKMTLEEQLYREAIKNGAGDSLIPKILPLIEAYAASARKEGEIEGIEFSKQAASDNMTFSGWEEDVNRRLAELKQQQSKLTQKEPNNDRLP